MSELKVYRASAGSGKTYTLTKEYMRLILSSEDPRSYTRVLAATFTNKATSELKGRVLKELYLIGKGMEQGISTDLQGELDIALPELQKRAQVVLKTILEDYSSFRIQTIDSFFQEVVRSFAYEISTTQAGADIELSAADAVAVSVDRLLMDKLSNPKLNQWVVTLMEEGKEEGERVTIREDLVGFASKFLFSDEGRKILASPEYSIEQVQEAKKELRKGRQLVQDRMTDKLKEITALQNEIQGILDAHFLEAKDSHSGFLITLLKRTPEELLYEQSKRGYCFGKAVYFSLKDDYEGAVLVAKNKIKQWAEATPELKEKLSSLMTATEEVLKCQYSKYTYGILLEALNLMPLLKELKQVITDYQREQNILFISEVNDLVKQVIAGSDIPFLYDKVGTHLEHYLIDEFQDTNSTQWENFKPLLEQSLANNQSNALVGDVKQSIYRWRGTDSSLLNNIEQDNTLSDFLRTETLEKNWRSYEHIVAFNNQFFADIYDYDKYFETSGYNVPEHQKVYEGENVRQESIHLGKDNGYVEACMDMGSSEEALDRMVETILALQDPSNPYIDGEYRAFSPGEIAIIVRENKDAARVADRLIQAQQNHPMHVNCFQFVSDEALTIENSLVVKIMLALFHCFATPNDGYYSRQLKILLRRRDQEQLAGDLLELVGGEASLLETATKILEKLGAIPPEEELFVNAFLEVPVQLRGILPLLCR